MTENCIKIIDCIKQQFPETWKQEIADYMDRQLSFYLTYPTLAKAEILYEYSKNKENIIFIKKLKDIYEMCPQTEVKTLYRGNVDAEYLVKRFCEEWVLYKKEVTDAF